MLARLLSWVTYQWSLYAINFLIPWRIIFVAEKIELPHFVLFMLMESSKYKLGT
jgi:hypothetical protein